MFYYPGRIMTFALFGMFLPFILPKALLFACFMAQLSLKPDKQAVNRLGSGFFAVYVVLR